METPQDLVSKMLADDQNKIENLKLQLAKLEETMEKVKADYTHKHRILITELNKTIGSLDTLRKLQDHGQKEKLRKSSDDSDSNRV